jgi:hypothetical protein
MHDFTGGITSAGLVWTVRLPDDALTITRDGRVLAVNARDVVVVDDRPAPAGEVPATVAFQITWKGSGKLRSLSGASPAFRGRFFRHARAVGNFAAAEGGFGFASSATKLAHSTFAELGTEQNGFFLAATLACPSCGGP